MTRTNLPSSTTKRLEASTLAKTLRALERRPKTEMDVRHDELSATIRQFCHHAELLGRKYGIRLEAFKLDEMFESERYDDSNSRLMVMLAESITGSQTISLTKHQGKWGLWFKHSGVAFSGEGRVFCSLEDTPLETRRKFVLRSQDFFNEYLELVQESLGSWDEAIEQGRQVLGVLEQYTSD